MYVFACARCVGENVVSRQWAADAHKHRKQNTTHRKPILYNRVSITQTCSRQTAWNPWANGAPSFFLSFLHLFGAAQQLINDSERACVRRPVVRRLRTNLLILFVPVLAARQRRRRKRRQRRRRQRAPSTLLSGCVHRIVSARASRRRRAVFCVLCLCESCVQYLSIVQCTVDCSAIHGGHVGNVMFNGECRN